MRKCTSANAATGIGLLVVVALAVLAHPALGAALPPEAQQRVPTATFEVVMEKPQHDSLTYERPLPFNLVSNIGYVGTKSINIVSGASWPINNAPLGTGNAGRPLNKKFGRTVGTNILQPWTGANYHSLQTSLERRFTVGMMVKTVYTWAHSIDNNSTDYTFYFALPEYMDRNRASSGFDRRHNFRTAFIYELPWGPGKRWMNDSTLGKVVGGWQVSGLLSAQSGVALTITGNGTALNTPGNTAYPDLNGDNKVLGGRGPGLLYFDPSVYSLPPDGAQGNMKRHAGPDGPGFWQLDMSLFKRFAVGNSRYAEFRIDAYNVPNSVRWGNPSTGYSTASGNTFGQITGTAGGQRSLRFGARFAF